MKVIDANVAAKWNLPERGHELARSFMRTEEALIAPAVIRMEVVSAIVRSVSDKRSTPEEAELRCKAWLEQLADRAIMTFEEDDLFPAAMRLGIKHSHYFIDCLYLCFVRRQKQRF